jgi:hypothetical protein
MVLTVSSSPGPRTPICGSSSPLARSEAGAANADAHGEDRTSADAPVQQAAVAVDAQG